MKWDDTKSVEESARERLPLLFAKFYAAGREVIEHEDAATLHQFRLRGKRVRYTLELFCPVYGPGLDQLLKGLRRAQTSLGEINDCATAHDLVANPQFHDWLAARQTVLHDAFRKYWLDEFDAPGREQHWVRYLRTYARRKQNPRQ